MDQALKDIYIQIERYSVPLVSSSEGSEHNFSKDENRILALQQINRLNQRLGQIARTRKEKLSEMTALQVYVNNLTMGVKNDNPIQIRSALASVRNYLFTEFSESKP